MTTLTIHYNYSLIAVSVLIAIGACYAALSLSDQVQTAVTRKSRRFWLAAGAGSMGFGIWSMHYLGMLAVELPVPVFYFWPTVLLSLLLAIAAAAVALPVLCGERLTRRRLFVGGLIMAADIGGMHYTGMAAMRSTAMEEYNPWMVAVSVVVAATFSWLALWTAFASRGAERYQTRIRLGASLIMGLGISSMHYTAMQAAHFTLCNTAVSMRHTVEVSQLGEWTIGVIAGTIFLVALFMATLDKWRYRDLQRANAELLAAQTALLEVQRELKDANAMLSELSVRDGLTGLYNRRHFDGALATEMLRAARSSKPISLLMIDVDQFKALNDGYGHQRGDDCLREIARFLEGRQRRGYDVVARYGGEEFVLLLPDAEATAAHAVADSIRQGILALGIENLGSNVADVVTVSIGLSSQYPKAEGDSAKLLKEADMALYEAKRLGRNRVEMAAVRAMSRRF